jgi:hypothetical protein
VPLAGSAQPQVRGEIRKKPTSRAGRRRALSARPMTRYDRLWEPLCFVLAAAIVWLGTL